MTLELNIFHLYKRHLHPEEEEGSEEVCLINTLVEEHCDKNLEENLNENLGVLDEGLPEPSDVLTIMSPWRRREEILPLFNEEDSKGAAREDPPKLVLKPLPVDLNANFIWDPGKLNPDQNFFDGLSFLMIGVGEAKNRGSRAVQAVDLHILEEHGSHSITRDVWRYMSAIADTIRGEQLPRLWPLLRFHLRVLLQRRPRLQSQESPPEHLEIHSLSLLPPGALSSPARPLRATPIANREHSMSRHILTTLFCDSSLSWGIHTAYLRGTSSERIIMKKELPSRMLLVDVVLCANLFPLQHRVQRRGAILEALFRISEGYYFGPHHLIMAALLHFEEKHLGLLPPAPPVAPVPSKPFASTDDFALVDDATPVAVPSTVAAEDPSYPPEEPTT
uniref:Uncharacterized protein n=1 Tax=Vitis vinifera TaxID=29760 RepID=A5BRR1_VITVI|nr:hypothetical protein VITISV_019825 [Vitis vinifera]